MFVSTEGETPMTTLTIARPVAAAATTRRPAGLGARFVTWLLALDAGYRGAHTLAHATDAALEDMGITRAEAHGHFARHTGTVDTPVPTGW
jgi:uncharacterized protein YjiS (DUF1127 family)